MKATIDGRVIAESDDVAESGGCHYFPREAVRLDWLEPSPKTDDDRRCPHGVKFYDVVVGGARHSRAAWCYEAPQPAMAATRDRFGFWQDVKVG